MYTEKAALLPVYHRTRNFHVANYQLDVPYDARWEWLMFGKPEETYHAFKLRVAAAYQAIENQPYNCDFSVVDGVEIMTISEV